MCSWFRFPGSDEQRGPQPDPQRALREQMVAGQIERRGVRDRAVLQAMRTVPRHLFVPPDQVDAAYDDTPLPVGYGQTISQPYIVALMTELARPAPTDRALEVGTGSGYQAAVLASVVKELWTIELVEPLAEQARARLDAAGIRNVTVRAGDGYAGSAEHAPFDIVIVTAAPEHVPPALVDQLARGGRLVIPVGRERVTQTLRLIEKDSAGDVRSRDVLSVLFVPLVRRISVP
jgi:protein-L-isoaspartate(D-aspartate) O-methyltransferase